MYFFLPRFNTAALPASPELAGAVLLSVANPRAAAQAVALLTGFSSAGLGKEMNQFWTELLARSRRLPGWWVSTVVKGRPCRR